MDRTSENGEGDSLNSLEIDSVKNGHGGTSGQ